MIGLNDLPLELYYIIFSNLSIIDLLNFRLVNKRFFNLSKNIKINEFKIPKEYLDGYWFYDNQKNDLIKEVNIINFKYFQRMISLSLLNLEINLNYLIINSIEDNLEFNLADLSKLINLECLEIRCELYGNQFVNFKNLKIFLFKFENIEFDNDNNYKFYLKTPKLEMIEFNRMNFIHFNHTESIKNIKTFFYEDQLKIFNNLERIQLNISQNLDGNLLFIFKKLNQLRILDQDFFNLNNETKNNIIKILNDRITLERKINIFIKGKFRFII